MLAGFPDCSEAGDVIDECGHVRRAATERKMPIGSDQQHGARVAEPQRFMGNLIKVPCRRHQWLVDGRGEIGNHEQRPDPGMCRQSFGRRSKQRMVCAVSAVEQQQPPALAMTIRIVNLLVERRAVATIQYRSGVRHPVACTG